MKKFLTLMTIFGLVLGIVSASFAAKAETKAKSDKVEKTGSSTKDYAVTFNPFALIFGFAWGGLWISGGFEAMISSPISIQADVDFLTFPSAGWNNSAVGLNVKGRYYLNQYIKLWEPKLGGISGWYGAAGIGFYSSTVSYSTENSGGKEEWSGTAFFIGPSIEFGYKYIFDDGALKDFFFEPCVGFTLLFGSYKWTYKINGAEQPESGTIPAGTYTPGGFLFGIRIGYSF